MTKKATPIDALLYNKRSISQAQATRLSTGHNPLWGGSKGVINFPWIFLNFFMQYGVLSLLGTSGPEYIRAFIHLVRLRVFSVTPWVIVYRLYCVRCQGQSDWFQKITLDLLRMMEYRVSKASTVPIITNCPLISSSAYFP